MQQFGVEDEQVIGLGDDAAIVFPESVSIASAIST
jgi:hypothetical protein